VAAAAAVFFGAGALVTAFAPHRWTPHEREQLRALTLARLEPLTPDQSNHVADDPRAAALGQELFFDTRLSGNGKVSCATCHMPDRDFQDGKPLANGVGTTARRTMPIAGTAHSPWFFWDGRADSQWEQALGPLESAAEHGGSRTQYAWLIASEYRAEYEAVFGRLPAMAGLPRAAGPVSDSGWSRAWQRIPAARRDDVSRVYANIGKAIAAFERRIEYAPSRFDRYAEAELAGAEHGPESSLTRDEEAGLRIFIGKGNCVNCHNGPMLTDNHFHNTGVGVANAALPVDSGRAAGAHKALNGEFNCKSKFSDARAGDCAELEFAVADGAELVRAYKTPSLRNVAARAPYMHAGQIATLAGVIAHYDSAPAAPFGHSELKPLGLSATERRQLEAFLRTLDGGPRAQTQTSRASR
jgi:cytochrome c peroxidase